MKEASGELNMTAITIIAIAAIAAFFYAFVWPVIKGNIENSQKCAAAICGDCSGKTMTCSYMDKDGNVDPNLTCPCKED